jgi:hypothetical protein
VEAAGGAVGADLDGDRFEEAGCDEAGAVGVEIEECVGGLPASDSVLIAQSHDRVGESGALSWGVDLLVHGGERVPAPIGVVVLDRFAQALEVGADQLRQRDQQREIERGEIEQTFPEAVECAVGEAVELVDRLVKELGDVRAGELLVGWGSSSNRVRTPDVPDRVIPSGRCRAKA